MTLAAGQRVHECRTARVYAAAFAVMGAISGTVALVDLQRGRVSSADAGWAAILGVAALLAVVLFVRALSFGIYVQPELVVVRSWFRTRHVPRAVIRRVRRAEYEGLLRLGPSFVVTEMLVIDTHDDGRIALPVSLCTERRARRALASIAAHGLEVAPKASTKAAPSPEPAAHAGGAHRRDHAHRRRRRRRATRYVAAHLLGGRARPPGRSPRAGRA